MILVLESGNIIGHIDPDSGVAELKLIQMMTEFVIRAIIMASCYSVAE